MNRGFFVLVSVACVGPLLLSGCKGNPFAYRESILKLRAPGDQAEPKTETVSTARGDQKTKDERLQDEETEFNRSEQSTSQRAEQNAQIVNELMQRAEDALATGDQETAAKFYQEVVRQNPAHKGALHRLAILFDMNGNFHQAERYFQRALEFAPEDPTLLNDVGYAYLRQQRLDESKDFLQASMNLDPDNPITLRNVGILLAQQGNPQAAEEFFKRGGLSREEAHREYASFLSSISTPGANQRSASIDELSKSQNTPTASGQFAPPDWESTYGLKSDAAPPDTERSSLASRSQQRAGERSDPLSERTESLTRIDYEDQTTEGTPQFSPEPAAGSGYSSYELERAALNAGPGSLFPIAALNADEKRQPRLRPPFARLQDWNTVQPAGFGEPASTERRDVPSYDSNSSRAQEPPFIQSPSGRAIDSRPDSYDSTGFPVTQQYPNDGSRISPSYYQFPGTSAQPPSSESMEDDYSADSHREGSSYR